MKYQKSFALFLISLSIVSIFLLEQQKTKNSKLHLKSEGEKKISEIEKNFQNNFLNLIETLKKNKSYPNELNSIQYIKYTFYSKSAKNLIRNHLPVNTSPLGENILEADFISMPKNPDNEFILQLGLIEISTKNKVWEYSENFKIEKEY